MFGRGAGTAAGAAAGVGAGADRTFTFGCSLGALRALLFVFPFGAALGLTFSSGCAGCADGYRCTLTFGRVFGVRRPSVFAGVTVCAAGLLVELFTAAGAFVRET